MKAEGNGGAMSRARELLASKHNMTIPDSDPIYGIVTLIEDAKNSLHDMIDQVMSEYHSKLISDIKQDIEPVREVLEDLTRSIIKENIKAVMAKVVADTALVEKFAIRVRLQMMWHAVLSVVSVIAAVILMISLFAR